MEDGPKDGPKEGSFTCHGIVDHLQGCMWDAVTSLHKGRLVIEYYLKVPFVIFFF